MSAKKLCLFCEHFDFETIWQGADYSEYTSGDIYGGMDCKKKHYTEVRPLDLADFRKTLLRAETCPDFKVAK